MSEEKEVYRELEELKFKIEEAEKGKRRAIEYSRSYYSYYKEAVDYLEWILKSLPLGDKENGELSLASISKTRIGLMDAKKQLTKKVERWLERIQESYILENEYSSIILDLTEKKNALSKKALLEEEEKENPLTITDDPKETVGGGLEKCDPV